MAEQRRFLTWQQVGDTVRALRIYEYVRGLGSQVEFLICERRVQLGHGIMRASYGNFLDSDSAGASGASKRAVYSNDQALKLSLPTNYSGLSRPVHNIKVDVEGTSFILWLAIGAWPLDPSHVRTFLEHTTAFIQDQIETYGPQRRIGGGRSDFDYNIGAGLRMHVDALPPNCYNWRMMDALVKALLQYHRMHVIDHELTFDVRRGPRPFGRGYIERSPENPATISADFAEASKRDVTLDSSDFPLNSTDDSLNNVDTALNDTLINEANLTMPNYSIRIQVAGTFLVMTVAILPNQPLNSWEITQFFLRLSIYVEAQMQRSGPATRIPGPRSSFDYTPFTHKMLFHAETQPPNSFTWSEMFLISKALQIYHQSHRFDHALVFEMTRSGHDFGSGFLRRAPPDITIANTTSANASSPVPNTWIQIVIRGQYDIFFLPGSEALPQKYLRKLIQRVQFSTRMRIRDLGPQYEIASPWHTSSSEGFLLELNQRSSKRMTLHLLNCMIQALEQVVFSEGHWVAMYLRVQDFDEASSLGTLRAVGALRWSGVEQRVDGNVTVD
ncbi:MAG: hypothetical protein Q9167_007701 [Letrouitia subvulpina]